MKFVGNWGASDLTVKNFTFLIIFFTRIKVLELEMNRLRGESRSAEAESSRHLQRAQDLGLVLNSAKSELEAAKIQHEEYKNKAKLVLWEKEKLIQTLRSNKANNSNNNNEEAEDEGFEDAELQQAM